MRTVFFLGVLAAVGAAVFGLVVPARRRRAPARPHALLLCFSFLLAFVGADAHRSTRAAARRGSSGARRGGAVALVGGVAAAQSRSTPAAIYVA